MITQERLITYLQDASPTMEVVFVDKNNVEHSIIHVSYSEKKILISDRRLTEKEQEQHV